VLDAYHLVERAFAERECRFVVYENRAAMMLAPLVSRWSPESVQILDAHNIDHCLLAQESDGCAEDEEVARHIARARWEESHLERFVDGVFACSEDDRRQLEVLNDGLPIFTVPNGVDTATMSLERSSTEEVKPNIIFCGSMDYPPNLDGMDWFCAEVFPGLQQLYPGIDVVVVGRGQPAHRRWMKSASIELTGEVPRVEPYYRRAQVAICPLRHGSGTRLKILEAMSLGTPVVSTSVGAEGIEADDGKHLLIADEAREFRDAIGRLLGDNELHAEIAANARSLVEGHYDWDVVGEQMHRAMQKLAEIGRR
jgi:glycosyltransferase involved in cell wall biosynthesis